MILRATRRRAHAAGGLAMLVGASAATPACAQGPAQSWTATLSAETRYYSFESSRSDIPGVEGEQVHVPVTLQVRGRVDKEWWVDLLARTSYVDSEQKTPRRSGQVSTMTDTSFSATLTHTPGKGPQPYVSLRVNAPTGRPVLLGSESFARMDYDLVGIPSFGEGWNFGPSAGVGVPLSKAVRLSLGGGYTERGAYDREGAINRTTGVQALNRFDAGDSTSLDASLSWQGAGRSAWVALNGSRATASRFNRIPYYRSGGTITASAGGWAGWSARWSSNLSGYYSVTDKNRIQTAASAALVREAFNSNSTSWGATLSTTWRKGKVSLTGHASYTDRHNNGYDPVTFQFVSEKSKWNFGLSTRAAVSRAVTLTGRIERTWTGENPEPDKIDAFNNVLLGTGVPPIDGRGWQVAIGASFGF